MGRMMESATLRKKPKPLMVAGISECWYTGSPTMACFLQSIQGASRP